MRARLKWYCCDTCNPKHDQCILASTTPKPGKCPCFSGFDPEWKKAYSWQAQIYATCIMCVITLIALWFGVGGCTKTAMKRIVRTEFVQCCHLPSPVVTEYTAFTHYEFLMRSKMEGAEMVVDGDYRHLAIESREQRPDPNTVRAITEGVVSGLVGL